MTGNVSVALSYSASSSGVLFRLMTNSSMEYTPLVPNPLMFSNDSLVPNPLMFSDDPLMTR